MADPRRGEIWFAELDPTIGHEQAGRRPVLIVSDDIYNASRAGLVVVAPLTSTLRPIRLHVRVLPPNGGLARESMILCAALRSAAKQRLIRHMGSLDAQTMPQVEDSLRALLGL